MSEVLHIALRAAAIGIGATLFLDLWSLFLKTAFRAPFPNYPMVGRWIAGFAHGHFVHADIARAAPVAGERVIGWATHYAIGVLYAFLLVAATGVGWLDNPTLAPALILGVVTVVAPLFVMQPAMGAGIASSKAANPNIARLRSLMAHTIFGFGLHLTAALLARTAF